METSRELTDVYADQGGYAYRKFQFACIRSGSSTLLKQTLSSEAYIATLVKLFCGDTAAALHALTFVAPQAVHAAVDGGLKKSASADMLRTFMPRLYRCQTATEVTVLNREFLVQLTKNAAKIK